MAAASSAVMAATRSQALYTALYKLHYTPLQGQKELGDMGTGALDNERGSLTLASDARGQTPGGDHTESTRR